VTEELQGRRHAEVYIAAILSFAGLATAWCGFQATIWNGEQAAHYGEASALRVESAMAAAAAGQATMVDIGMYLNWIDAVAAADTMRARFLRDRFRPEFVPAFDAWLATSPRDSIGPATPFAMREYRLAKHKEAAHLEELAVRTFTEGQRANDRSDRYTFVTVILASSLFFAGISQQFRRPRIQSVLIAGAGLLCLLGIVMLLRLPVE
jgi:hypothetical protein